MRVVVLGKGLMLANIVQGVVDSGADLVGVFRYEATCTPKWKLDLLDFFRPAPEVTLLNKLKVNQIKMKSANSQAFRDLMLALNVDLIIIGTWRERICRETFNIPTIGTVNVHPSLLPRYRGPNPYIQTILHGEKFSGVTLHLLSEKFDEGPVLKQQKVEILESDTSKELREKSAPVARELVCEFIKDFDERIITPIPQNEKNATYFGNISGEERMLDFNNQSSVEISRTIRALHPFLPCYITYNNSFFVVNPYKFEILPESCNSKSGSIISKNPETKSLTIVCADYKAIKFNNLTLYNAPLLTRIYIKNFVKL